MFGWKDEPSWGHRWISRERPAHLVETTMAIVPPAPHPPHPYTHTCSHHFPSLLYQDMTSHMATHYLALTLEFHCSWPSLKLANRPGRAGWGTLKGEGGAESPPCSQHGCLPAQDRFLQPSISGTPTSLSPGAGTPHPLLGAVLQEKEQRGLFGVLFRGPCSPTHPLYPGHVITIRNIRRFNSN